MSEASARRQLESRLLGVRPFTGDLFASPVFTLPWSMVGEMYVMRFRGQAAYLTSLLPSPLAPGDDPSEAYVWSARFATYPSGIPADQVDPYRSGYDVLVLGIPCSFAGRQRLFSCMQWCNRDWLVIASWLLGACSKFASIEDHRLTTGPDNAQTFPSDAGDFMARKVSRSGDLVAWLTLRVTSADCRPGVERFFRHLPLLCHRHLPDWNIDRGGVLASDLCEMAMDEVHIHSVVGGYGSLIFGQGRDEGLRPIGQVDVLEAQYVRFRSRLLGLRKVCDV